MEDFQGFGILEDHGRSWKIMEDHGRSWKIMEDYGRSWKIMEAFLFSWQFVCLFFCGAGGSRRKGTKGSQSRQNRSRRNQNGEGGSKPEQAKQAEAAQTHAHTIRCSCLPFRFSSADGIEGQRTTRTCGTERFCINCSPLSIVFRTCFSRLQNKCRTTCREKWRKLNGKKKCRITCREK